jgi:TrpR-related protein YerC/YecD
MNDDTDELMLAVLQLKSLAEARAFFGDVCTEKEIKEVANRWKAAKMLNFGVGYRKIERVTGMSSATISRIRKKMEDGLGGYRLMMSKLGQK